MLARSDLTHGRHLGSAIAFGLGICAVPVSIAVAESLLGVSLLLRATGVARGEKVFLPRIFWFWLGWAGLEIAAWFSSPEIRLGAGEIRHLLLIAALFLLVPTLGRVTDRVTVWRGVVLAATVSSAFLIGHFVWQLLFYRGSDDPVIYLRSGGLLHHWMVYAVVELSVFAGLLELLHFYPGERQWLLPALILNSAAILVSLTRTLWICCLLLVAIHLVWNRSRWIWAVPAIPCILFVLAPGAVRARVMDSGHPDYYSNSERIQMLRVGMKMIRDRPIAGVGPGRVEELYTGYLPPGDPVPAYHGHLHNNLVQLAAEFGLPVTMAAVIFVVALFRDLIMRCKCAVGRDGQFLCRTSLLALTGFVLAGFFDYTYGHSLGLILIGFAVLSPLVPNTIDV